MMVITNSKGPQVFKNDAKSTKRPRNNIKKHKLTMFQSVRPLYSIKFNAIATWLWQLSLNSSLRCLNFKGILTSKYYAFSFYILLMLRELIDPTLDLKRNWDHRFMILKLGYSKVVRPICWTKFYSDENTIYYFAFGPNDFGISYGSGSQRTWYVWYR